MIAVNSSSLIAFLAGDSGSDVDALEDALSAQILTLPPVVLTETLSDPKLPKQVTKIILDLPGNVQVKQGLKFLHEGLEFGLLMLSSLRAV